MEKSGLRASVAAFGDGVRIKKTIASKPATALVDFMLLKSNKEMCAVVCGEQEKWLPIIGFKGLYEVSDHGRVKSLARTVIRSDGKKLPLCERILKTSSIYGYFYLDLFKNGIGHKRRVHRLVVQAFHPDYSDELETDHIDGDPQNNHFSNLRMVTSGENSRAYRTKKKGCSSQYRGVSWKKSNRKWIARVGKNGITIHIGLFSSEKEAAKAWNAKAIELGFFKEALNLV